MCCSDELLSPPPKQLCAKRDDNHTRPHLEQVVMFCSALIKLISAVGKLDEAVPGCWLHMPGLQSA